MQSSCVTYLRCEINTNTKVTRFLCCTLILNSWQGMVFGLVGFSAGIIGTAVSNGLLALRKQLDPDFKLQNAAPAILPNAGCWGAHMAVSSNLRYQMLNGLDLVPSSPSLSRSQSPDSLPSLFPHQCDLLWKCSVLDSWGPGMFACMHIPNETVHTNGEMHCSGNQ